jgi:hypothetical protein
VPRAWKIAKIVVLRKPNKPDYSKPNAYRPISLLPTISKGLEALVATRISYLAETEGLLPQNHFGARKQRSSEQALNILVERIHDAWRSNKVLSLVTFDVQGAYNGVDPRALSIRLWERRIPQLLINWVESFCAERRAHITFDGFSSDTAQIAQAGLPQGSPLSPVLYLFYNANLVASPINHIGGSIAFVDDYSAWVMGPNASANTLKLQETVIPRALAWAKEGGATFQAEKTELIHFTRVERLDQKPQIPLRVGEQLINPNDQVKLLGVIMDSKMRMKRHVARATARAMKQCMTLRRLKGLRPRQMRQLYMATIVPKMDYAASAWYRPNERGCVGIRRMLDSVQRLGAKMVVSAFRTVSTAVLEAEAGLLPTDTRLKRRLLSHTINLHTLPGSHPFWNCKTRAQRQGVKYTSPLALLLQEFAKEIGTDGQLEKLEPFCMAPYEHTLPADMITIEADRTAAIQQAS